MVDAISGAGAMPLETEAWGVDVVVVGSQKALALPPGLAFVALSARAPGSASDEAKSPRFYFDLKRERKAQTAGESAFTPAISLVVALKAALDSVEAQGGVDALVENAGDARGHRRAPPAQGARPAAALAERPRRRADRALPAEGPRGRRRS